MVVCKCRKATKLYCYVHKVPVCGECICSEEHRICVVRTYGEWVIDGDFCWPPKCNSCQEELQDDKPTCRLGCLHLFHMSCLEAHLKSFPDHTAPADYKCPECSLPVWPPPNFRDSNFGLPAELKEVISQAGLAQVLLGDKNTFTTEQNTTPPAFSNMPLVTIPVEDHTGVTTTSEISEEPPKPSTSVQSPQLANSIARKSSYRPEKVAMGPILHIEDNVENEDPDAVRRKYARRGPLYKQILRNVLPFRSQPTLPVTIKDEEYPRRRYHRQSRVDRRTLIVFFGFLVFGLTIWILYKRLGG